MRKSPLYVLLWAVVVRVVTSIKSSHWVVVTSINAPTTSVRVLAALPGWLTVVVGDLKSPNTTAWLELPTVTYLDLAAQQQLRYRILDYLPFNHYARKNIGYLYAIEHGAEVIYDTDDDNLLHPSSAAFPYCSSTSNVCGLHGSSTDSHSCVTVELRPGTAGISRVAQPEPELGYCEPGSTWVLREDVPETDVVVLHASPLFPSTPVVNPFVHFGQPAVWPRGLPLQYVHAASATVSAGRHRGDVRATGASEAAETQTQAQFASAARGNGDREWTWSVQQLLAQQDPDTDAIFRLTQGERVGGVVFDSLQPPCTPAPGLIAPVNSQATVFRARALWGLLIPVSTPFRVCDIWRGYWMQPLLWMLRAGVVYTPATVTHERNPHDYFHDFNDELLLYTRAGELVSLLTSFHANMSLANTTVTSTRQLFTLATALTERMAGAGLWGEQQVLLARAWFEDLAALGYSVFPGANANP